MAGSVTGMRAVVVEAGDQLVWHEVPDITTGRGEVLIKVRAVGVNRADLLQAAGRYPPPPGASEILGLEVAGTVVAAGPGCSRWSVGQDVCALLVILPYHMICEERLSRT